MIDLYYWPTPNGHKITMFLEETGTQYRIVPINIGKGEQFQPDFLRIAPNNRMPAIVDSKPADGGAPISVFESGAILLYLAEKTGKFLPKSVRGRVAATEWLFWQMGGLGPMAGQNHHFSGYAPEKIQYAIADMAAYPWTVSYERQGQRLEDFPHLKRWFRAIEARPATERAYAKGKEVNPQVGAPMSEDAKKVLFGQTAAVVR